MGKFLTELVVTPQARGMWVLRQDLEYESDGGQLHIAPTGFSCDLASIPAIFEGWVSPSCFGDFVYAPAAVMHDYTLSLATVPSSVAHDLFRECLYACEGAKDAEFLIHLFYHAVNRPKESEMKYDDITESEGQNNKGIGD